MPKGGVSALGDWRPKSKTKSCHIPAVPANPLNSFNLEKSFSHPQNLPYLPAVLPTGNAVRDGVSWGRTGASVLRLTWLQGRGGLVQGFPLGHYGPGALDDALGGAGRKCLARTKRNGLEQKSPAGRGLAPRT